MGASQPTSTRARTGDGRGEGRKRRAAAQAQGRILPGGAQPLHREEGVQVGLQQAAWGCRNQDTEQIIHVPFAFNVIF